MSLDNMLLTVTPSNCSVPFTGSDGCLIANGKIGIISSLNNDIDVTRVVITRNLSQAKGQFLPNITETFQPYRLSAFTYTNENSNITYTLNNCSLLLENGMYESLHTICNIEYNAQLNVKTKLYALRHMPFSTLQTFEITPTLGSNLSNCELYHQVYTQNNLKDVDYDHTFIRANNQNLYQFHGTGKTTDGLHCAFATNYLFELPDSNITMNGAQRPLFNSDLLNLGFYHISLRNLTLNSPIRFHAITTLMTNDDYDDPLKEARSISLNIATLRSTVSQTISFIAQKHLAAWNELWQSKIQIVPRDVASLIQVNEVNQLNKLLNVAMYNIYACVRENFNIEIGDGIPILDFDGMFLYDADIWLLPILIIIKPILVKSILDYRFKTLESAKKLAASYGKDGAKYPYINDSLGYRNNLFYMPSSFTYVFNSCMIAITTWNFYRVSRDYDWLQEKGYKIIFNIANFIASIAVYDENNYVYYFEFTSALNGTISERDHAMTNNFCKLALRYAIEASYELKLEFPDKWNIIYEGIVSLKWPTMGSLTNVSKFDSNALINDLYQCPDTLFNYIPSFWEEERLLYTNNVTFIKSVQSNSIFYSSNINPNYVSKATNNTLTAITSGVSLSVDSSNLPTFSSNLQSFIDNNISGPWYYMKYESPVVPVIGDSLTNTIILNRTPNKYYRNSIYTNAMFLNIFTQGIGQIRVTGGVGENRFRYADFKISSTPAVVMPNSWNMVSFNNLGMNNSLVTLDTRPSTLGGSNIFPPSSSTIPNFNIYTP